MIRLSARKYYLEGVSEDFFWEELDKITAGQSTNPEFGYIRPMSGNAKHIFLGRKTGNQFSIFRYRPWSKLVGTLILCKGIVSARGSGITINCSFGYPFSSLVMFVVLLLWVLVAGSIPIALFPFHGLYSISFVDSAIAGLILTGLYCLLLAWNLSSIEREMAKQLELIEKKVEAIGFTLSN